MNDIQISNCILDRPTFAKFFAHEILKYNSVFKKPILLFVSFSINWLYPLSNDDIPPFADFFNSILNFKLEINQTISRILSCIIYYPKYSDNIINICVDVLLNYSKKPILIQMILTEIFNDFPNLQADLNEISQQSNQEKEIILENAKTLQRKLANANFVKKQVFNFLSHLEICQIDENFFNTIIQNFLLPQYTEQIIDYFFSLPKFDDLPKGCYSSLVIAFAIRSYVSNIFSKIGI